jgi:AcrR family transcriptional regulator
VDAAIKLFGARGYYTTTIKDIAREAGISPGLIYQYFKDKEDVLLLALLECVDSYAREIPPAAEAETHPIARLYAAYGAYCGVVDRNKDATVLAYRSTKSLDKRRRKLVMQRELETNALLSKYVMECVEKRLVRETNVDLVSYQLVMMAHSWALKSWHFADQFSFDDYVRQTFDIAIYGLLTPAGKRSAQSQI